MSKGAIIIRIGGVELPLHNYCTSEEETRTNILDKLKYFAEFAKKKGIPPDVVSVKYDPNFNWDD